MQTLSLNEVIRYALAGVVALLALMVLCPDAHKFFGKDATLAQGVLIGGLVLTWGATIYILHRAVAYPVLWRLVLFPYLRRQRVKWSCLFVPYWLLKQELERDQFRWAETEAESAQFREWRAQVHFLYSTGWALLSAWGIASLFGCSPGTSLPSSAIPIAAPLFALVGLLHDSRLTRTRNAWLTRKAAAQAAQVDHVRFGVSDYAASKAFFLAALQPLGVAVVMEGPYGLGLGRNGKSSLWMFQTAEKPAHLHLAFTADDRKQVEAFYRAALVAGGKDNGAPGLRPHYDAKYYGAFVIGPDGHNVEAVCHKPEA